MLVLTALLAAASAALAPCERVQTTPAGAASTDKPTVRRLDTMPPARQILGVVHLEGGCPRPIVVHEEVGAPGHP